MRQRQARSRQCGSCVPPCGISRERGGDNSSFGAGLSFFTFLCARCEEVCYLLPPPMAARSRTSQGRGVGARIMSSSFAGTREHAGTSRSSAPCIPFSHFCGARRREASYWPLSWAVRRKTQGGRGEGQGKNVMATSLWQRLGARGDKHVFGATLSFFILQKEREKCPCHSNATWLQNVLNLAEELDCQKWHP